MSSDFMDYLPPFDSDPEGFEAQDLFSILEHYGSKMETVPKGTVLYRAESGILPPDLCLLKSGSVKACRLTPSGDEQIYNTFRSGTILFSLSGVRNECPELDFITTMPTNLIRVKMSLFQDLLFSDPRIMYLMMMSLAEDLERAYRRLRESESYGAEWKLCNMLLSFAERSGVEYDGKILIRERISQQTMASMLRVSRITVARTLKDLKDYGLIESVNGYFCIRDEEKLRQHMYYISLPLE